MRIRSATAADIPAILALDGNAATSAHYSEEQYRQMIAEGASSVVSGDARSGLNPGPTAELPIPKETGVRDELSRVVLVGEEHSAIKGFLIGRILGAEWEIENLVVAGDVRRKGLGKQLVGELLVQARRRGARKVFLEVRESNAAARRLYEKSQFVESGRRRNYYQDPEEDAVLYTKDLSRCT